MNDWTPGQESCQGVILESKGVLLNPEVNLDTLEKGSAQSIVPTSLDIGSRLRSQHSSETSSNWSIGTWQAEDKALSLPT